MIPWACYTVTGTGRLARSPSGTIVRNLAWRQGTSVMETATGIQKTYRIVKLGQQRSDFAFWQTQSCQARLAALEQIRREYHRWKYGAEPRLQRVCSVAQR